MPLRVRYVECDMQGRVFNAHYLTWADMAHTEALRALTGGYQGLTERGIDFVVVAAEVQFRRPARFDDELMVNVTIEPPGHTSLRSRFRIERGIERGAELIAEVAMVHVCVDARTFEKMPWPDWFRDELAHS
jgi:acyl-CoA thioester hydrolase